MILENISTPDFSHLSSRARPAWQFFVCRKWCRARAVFIPPPSNPCPRPLHFSLGVAQQSHARYRSNSPLRPGFFPPLSAGCGTVPCRPGRKPRCRSATGRRAQPPRRPLAHCEHRVASSVRRCTLAHMGCASGLSHCARLSINEALRSLGSNPIREPESLCSRRLRRRRPRLHRC